VVAVSFLDARRHADLDGVTDLLNHRAIQERLKAALARAKRERQPLTIVMMDLNNFKFFNDTYGHPVGDQVLRTVADSLREICRADDIIGRYGGDEFIAILTDTEAQGALEVCSRIAARTEEKAYQDPAGRRIPIGLSFGASVYPHDGETAHELLSLSDANLYEAKRGGAPAHEGRKPAEEAQELKKLREAGEGGSFGVLDALVTAIDNKDHYTRRHSDDVTHWAGLMALELGLSTETQRAVRIGALLHDIGKIAVPDRILNKSGILDDDEYQIMQQHPVFGALIVKDVPNLKEVLDGIRHHHERYDGRGYPDRLQGEAIPLMARLLAVPDTFSAMTNARPYRPALSWDEALNEIRRVRGSHLDPQMTDAFLKVIQRVMDGDASASFDKTGSRQSVLQLPTRYDHTPGKPADTQPAGPGHTDENVSSKHSSPETTVLRPRSVADADTQNS
jgi:diguanylate cyclase (GGDEF)-like protein/putative nucleotidyltransferase with HDIG domain